MATVKDAFRDLVGALLGISAFSPPTMPGPEIGDASVDAARKAFGGNLEVIPPTRLRWYPPDIERAQFKADNGDMMMVGQLSQSMELDGVIRGLGDARASVVNFPKRFYGSDEVVSVLRTRNASDRNVYEEMIPRSEKRLMVKDAMKCGVSIGEMVPVVGRNFPVLIRRFPQNLYFLQNRNQWYYRSIAGLIPIQPGIPMGDGNWWVLHIPGGRLAPHNSGLWNTLGRSYINKTHALFARQAYEFRHSQPARVAESPLGATESERLSLLQQVIKWAMNAAFVMPPGYTVKLVESNGQGVRVYGESLKFYNEEIATSICGSSAMLQGTVGFGNIDAFKIVAKDLREDTAFAWDHTENTQILPAFIGQRWGTDALDNATTVETDVSEPVDKTAEANTSVTLANAIKGMVEAIAEAQKSAGVTTDAVALDLREVLARFGVPTKQIPQLIVEAVAGVAAQGVQENGSESSTPPEPPKSPGGGS